MSYNINEELITLEETKEQIKQAIIDKGQSISPIDSFRSYVDKIEAIETGGIDTSDATATVDDIADGVTAYVKGQKITGNVRTVSYPEQVGHYATNVHDSSTLTFDARVGESTLYRSDSLITISAGHEDVASALNITSDQIARGSSILGVDGTFDGIDTSDATAVASDIVSGKTAYVNGEKITGTIEEVLAGGGVGLSFSRLSRDTNHTRIDVVSSFNESDYMMRTGSNVVTSIPNYDLSSYIGLTPNKLKRGETILGVVGTLDEGIDTSDATATSSDIAQGKSAYVDGSKINGTLPIAPDGTLESYGLNLDNISDDGLELSFELSSSIRCLADTSSVFTAEASYSSIASTLGITADKIKSGETICGVEGNYSGTDTSDATATVSDILDGKTAYVQGSKLIGTFVPVMTQEEYDSALAKAQTILGGV